MKAGEVLETLRISRSTLRRFVLENKIRTKKLPNGRYEYDDESVYQYLLESTGKRKERKTIIYGRVASYKEREQLEKQIDICKQFCIAKGWKIDGIYQDIAVSIDFDNRKDFQILLNEVLSYSVGKIVVAYKDRIAIAGFNFISNLFSKFGTEIIVINNIPNKDISKEEVLKEIEKFVSLFPEQVQIDKKELNKILI